MVRELGLDLDVVQAMYSVVHDTPYVMINVSTTEVETLAEKLGTVARRYYVSDDVLHEAHLRSGASKRELVEARLPNHGPVMAGDFGEILAAVLQAAAEHPTELLDPKKMRLKENRTSSAHGSDVVQFDLPMWPNATDTDRVICSEVKTKSTNGASTPIESALADSTKDREGRLVKTLAWLRERALYGDLNTVTADQIKRFIGAAVDHPPAIREFRAVAVICSSLVNEEISSASPASTSECTLVIISVPDLKANYQALYQAIVDSTAEGADDDA